MTIAQCPGDRSRRCPLISSLPPWVVIRACSCLVQRQAVFWSPPVGPAPRLSRPFSRPFQSFLLETPVGPVPRLSRSFLPFLFDSRAGTIRRAGQRFRFSWSIYCARPLAQGDAGGARGALLAASRYRLISLSPPAETTFPTEIRLPARATGPRPWPPTQSCPSTPSWFSYSAGIAYPAEPVST